MSPYRKPNKRFGWMEVRICGRNVSKSVICTLPPGHNPGYHAAVAMTDDGGVVAIVVGIMAKDVDMWQLVEAPE